MAEFVCDNCGVINRDARTKSKIVKPKHHNIALIQEAEAIKEEYLEGEANWGSATVFGKIKLLLKGGAVGNDFSRYLIDKMGWKRYFDFRMADNNVYRIWFFRCRICSHDNVYKEAKVSLAGGRSA